MGIVPEWQKCDKIGAGTAGMGQEFPSFLWGAAERTIALSNALRESEPRHDHQTEASSGYCSIG